MVFLTDDHAQWAVNCYGASELHSPSMNAIAAGGARMANSFTPCPVCSPARASFWTGATPSGHGVHDHIAERAEGRDHPGIIGQTTLADRLSDVGYTCGLAGKWHCHHEWQQPAAFDFWFTSALGTSARFGKHVFYDGKEKVQRRGHQAPMYADAAVRFLRERDTAKPFFLFVGFTDTHTPHQGSPPRLVERYRDCNFDCIPDEHDTGAHGHARLTRPDDATMREHNAQYFAAVNHIDEQVGRIIDELQSQQLTDDTLVVYTADHGHMNGHHGLWSKGNATVPQNFLEESIRVPAMLTWPGRIAPGQTCDAFADHCDLHATLADAAGAPLIDTLPGRSYLPLLTGESTQWRDAQYCEYGNARMIRSATHKYIQRFPGPNGDYPDELYDLATDPRETRNVIAENTDLAADLKSRLEAHFAKYETPDHTGRTIENIATHNAFEPWQTRVA